MIAGIPVQNRSLDILKQAVTYVRGLHRDEYVAERAREIVAQGGGTERADGSSVGSGTGVASTRLSLDNLPPAVSETAKRVGLTPQHVVDFCRANNMTVEQWMAMANEQKVLTSTAPFTFEMAESAVGANVRPF